MPYAVAVIRIVIGSVSFISAAYQDYGDLGRRRETAAGSWRPSGDESVGVDIDSGIELRRMVGAYSPLSSSADLGTQRNRRGG
jgi:hypothetical protein